MNSLNGKQHAESEEEGRLVDDSIRPNLLLPRSRKLILHLDLNNTILVSDAATGQGQRAALNSYLSTVTWGQISDTGEWHWLSDQPSLKPPCEGAVNFYTHFGRCLDFSDTEMGQKFKDVFDQHIKLLEWEGEADKAFAQKEEDGKCYHWILPSFFHLLESLHQQGRRFTVILRTFGTDLPRVLQSVHAALDGKHPHFPQLQQVPLNVDLTLGRIRCNKRETVLTHGPDRLTTRTKEENIYNHFSKMSGIGGFQDHFDWWARNHFTAAGGKPFWVDPNDCENHHIIIDDNIRLGEDDTIVNSRVLLGKNSRKVPTSELYDVCLVQTDLLRAIADKNYFLDSIAVCEGNYERYLQRYELD